MTMEPLPDHPVVRALERTGYPLRAGRAQGKEPDDGEELHRDPPRVP